MEEKLATMDITLQTVLVHQHEQHCTVLVTHDVRVEVHLLGLDNNSAMSVLYQN